MPTPSQELLEQLSGKIRLSALRSRLGNDLTPFLEPLYELWRSNRLVVTRDWGDPSLEAQPVLYTNRACLLPSDCLQWVDRAQQQKTVTIATWNLNSLRSRMPLLLSWLEARRPEIVCLQETKVEDGTFPHQELALAGYQAVYSGQKTYNGVAILSQHPIEEVKMGFSNGYDLDNKRLIAAKILGIWILNVYVPQGESLDSPKFSYKLQFLEELLHELEQGYDPLSPLLLVGDYNIAPDERDVSHPQTMADQVSFHPREHQFLDQCRAWQLEDVFRRFHDEKGWYTWWDFRTKGFERNEGMRIDHIWASTSFLPACQSCEIDTETRGQVKPSDHAPVLSQFVLPV